MIKLIRTLNVGGNFVKINEMSKEELELLSLCDITSLILKENTKPMNTPTVFKKICELLGYSDDEYANKIGEYYTSLTTDKRFIMLDSAEWDLRDNHSIKIEVEDEELEEVEEDIEEIEETEENLEENIDGDSLELEDSENDFDELTIVVEGDEEEEMN